VENSYKRILKGTAILGSVQVFTILVNLIRGKLIAIFLGTHGMGIYSLLNVSMTTIQQSSSLGLNLSIVKEISSTKDQIKYLSIVRIARSLLYLTAILGALVSLIFSSKLSLLTFGTDAYKYQYMLLSIVILFTTVSNGELSILQALGELKKIAYSSIVGAVSGLIIGIPLYYYWGYSGIVPSMICLSIIMFLFYAYNTRKIRGISNNLSWVRFYCISKRMIILGLVLMVSTTLGTLANYTLNSFIGRYGSISDVGLYQAANSMTNQYIGLVFSAMSLDYFPRLSSVSFDNAKIKVLVNQQSEIILLIISPLAILFISLAPIIIRILLTKDFVVLVPMIRWMGIGMLFKAIAFPMGYISFAKGDKKTFFWLEGIFGNILILSLNMIFYMVDGLRGLGISFAIAYFIFDIVYIFVTKNKYNFSHSKSLIYMILPFFVMVLITLFASFCKNLIFSNIIMSIMFLISLLVSWVGLRKRLK